MTGTGSHPFEVKRRALRSQNISVISGYWNLPALMVLLKYFWLSVDIIQLKWYKVQFH